MKSIIFHAENHSLTANIGLLLFRLYIGLTMAFAHGLGKIQDPSMMTGGLRAMGLPAPELLAWLAAIAEFGGGLFIALGLMTRLSTTMLGATMAVAGFVAHASDPFQKKELAMTYLASCVVIWCIGAGKFSVDKMIRK